MKKLIIDTLCVISVSFILTTLCIIGISKEVERREKMQHNSTYSNLTKDKYN